MGEGKLAQQAAIKMNSGRQVAADRVLKEQMALGNMIDKLDLQETIRQKAR